MNIELNTSEVGLLISSLTEMRLHLQEQRKLFLETSMPQWVADCDAQLIQVDSLKERLFK